MMILFIFDVFARNGDNCQGSLHYVDWVGESLRTRSAQADRRDRVWWTTLRELESGVRWINSREIE